MIVSMKHELAWWFDIDLAIAWSWVQVLGEPKLNILFAIFGFGMKVKG